MNASATIARYHRTLAAARALRAAYVAAITSGEPVTTITAARNHYTAAWSQYVALCRQYGLLAAHS